MKIKNRRRVPALIAAVGVAGGVAAIATAFAPSRPPTTAAATKATAVAATRFHRGEQVRDAVLWRDGPERPEAEDRLP